MERPDPSRVSFTARIVAYYRQFSDVPFAKDVARLISADEAVDDLVRSKGLDRDKLWFYAPLFEARYEAVSAALAGSRQILELASGFSLRGLHFSRDPSVRYVETDLPGVTEEKARIVSTLRGSHGLPDHGNHVLAVADALDEAQLREAASSFHADEPLTVVNEGLIQYLSRDEIERLATNVRGLLAEGGRWITPDFGFAADVRGIPDDRKALRDAIAGVTDRRLDAAAFEDEADLAAFLERAGFRYTVRSQLDVAPPLTSTARLGLPDAMIAQMGRRMRLWEMRPL